MKKTKGFTLVELMVVIVIIGILAALAIPKFMGATNKTKATEFKPILKQIVTLQTSYKQEKDKYSDDKTGASIGFSAPENVAGSTPSGVLGSARFEYQVVDPSVAASAGIAGVARPAKDDGTLKDMDGKALTKAKDAGCADTLNMFSVKTDSKLGTVTNLDPVAACAWQ